MSEIYGNIRFDDKIAVITGGASGMGREIATAFAQTGAKVVVGDINQEGLASLKAELGIVCEVLATDVTNEKQVEALVKTAVSAFGGVDIGVNCAGYANTKPLLEMKEESWDRIVALNLKGVFLSLKHQARQMREQGRRGVIINLTSNTASSCAIGQAHYASAKAGANHLTRIAAEEFRELGIRVVALAPGLIRTPLAQPIWDNPTLLDEFLKNVPCNRVGEVTDIARTTLFLASEWADYINGTVIYVEGGQTANGAISDLGGIRGDYKAE